MEKEKVPVSLLTLVGGLVVAVISYWVAQNNGLMPEQASEQAPLVDNFFNVMIGIGTAFFIVVEGTILLFLIKFRRKPGETGDGSPIDGNLPLEIFWTAIPSLIVIGLGVYSVEIYQSMGGFNPAGQMMMGHSHGGGSHQMANMAGSAIAAPLIAEGEEVITPEPVKPQGAKFGIGATPAEMNQRADVIVNVTGIQYGWLFEYPDTGILAGELHVPIGKDVQLNIAAKDVIHSFWVPQFRLKQDALPGKPTELRFRATKLGSYPVVCAELCGAYHGAMRSQAIVHSQEEYDQWIATNMPAPATETENSVSAIPSTIPVQTSQLTESEYLAPYAEEMGVNEATLKQVEKVAHKVAHLGVIH